MIPEALGIRHIHFQRPKIKKDTKSGGFGLYKDQDINSRGFTLAVVGGGL